MEQRIGEFRRAVEAHFGGRPGRGARYPEALRAAAVELVEEGLARGRSLAEMGRRLKIGTATLGRWLEAPAPAAAELRVVEVVEEEPPPAPPPAARPRLVLVTAGGHRVEGLGVAEAIRLLEALG